MPARRRPRHCGRAASGCAAPACPTTRSPASCKPGRSPPGSVRRATPATRCGRGSSLGRPCRRRGLKNPAGQPERADAGPLRLVRDARLFEDHVGDPFCNASKGSFRTFCRIHSWARPANGVCCPLNGLMRHLLQYEQCGTRLREVSWSSYGRVVKSVAGPLPSVASP